MPRDEELRDQLAEPTLRRIRADRQGVSRRLRPLLDTIARRLFEERFNVDALWEEHGLRKSAYVWFIELRTTPSNYIADASYEVARRLLSETGIPIWRIAYLLGVSERAFGRAFKKRGGCMPKAYRMRGGPRRTFALDAKLGEALVGGLSEDESAELLESLRDATTRVRTLYSPGGTADAAKHSELAYVEATIWPRLAGLPFEEQRDLVRQCRPFSTSAFYDFLHQKSREEGRRDRRRGIDLARLAVDTLDANKHFLGDLFPTLRPQAHAWVGNTRRLDLDFLGADREIRTALRKLRQTSDPFAAGIVYLCEGTLRMFQRRHDEAIEAFDVAMPAFEEAEETSWMISTLTGRASALFYTDQLKISIETLQKARQLLRESNFHALEIEYDLTIALVASERFDEAMKTVVKLEAAADRDKRPLSRHLVHWVMANIHEGLGEYETAERLYLATSQELESLGEPIYLGLLLLDLAVMYATVGKSHQVSALTQSIYPTFAAARLYDETLASIEMLSCTTISAADLHTVRSCLRHDPLVALWSKGR